MVLRNYTSKWFCQRLGPLRAQPPIVAGPPPLWEWAWPRFWRISGFSVRFWGEVVWFCCVYWAVKSLFACVCVCVTCTCVCCLPTFRLKSSGAARGQKTHWLVFFQHWLKDCRVCVKKSKRLNRNCVVLLEQLLLLLLLLNVRIYHQSVGIFVVFAPLTCWQNKVSLHFFSETNQRQKSDYVTVLSRSGCVVVLLWSHGVGRWWLLTLY